MYNERVRLSATASINAFNTARFLHLHPIRKTGTCVCMLILYLFTLWYLVHDNAGNETDRDYNDDDDHLPYELNRKLVSECFWNGECESELREANNINYKFLSVGAREHLMAEIDKNRATSTYPHNVCCDECKRRGIRV